MMTRQNVKKFTCMLLAAVLAFIGVFPVSASAAPIVTEEIVFSDNVLYTATGKNISSQLANRLDTYGVSIDDDTLLQVVRPNDRSTDTVLMVTDVENETMFQNVFMVLDENSEVIPIPVPDPAGDVQLMGTNEGLGAEIDDVFADGSFVFDWAVLFDWARLASGKCFARPKHAQFACFYDSSDGYSVTNAVMDFSTGGAQYNSNFVCVDSSSDFCHSIIVTQSTVARNTYYSRTNAYNANQWIGVTDTGYFTVDVSFKVNGRLISERYDVFNLFMNSGRA